MTSNYPFSAWREAFGDDVVASAMIEDEVIRAGSSVASARTR